MKFKFPIHLKSLLHRLSIILLFMQLSRLVFYIFNKTSFTTATFKDIFVGLWFDMITIALLCLPFIILSTLPFKFRAKKGYQIFLKIIFHLINSFILLLNLVDVEYFKYTSKRSTIDLLTILGAGNDFKQQITSFLRDFWFLTLFFILFIWLTNWLYNKTRYQEKTLEISRKTFVIKNTSLFLVVLSITVLIGRGGFNLKPSSSIDASKFTRVENTALVLNTPFTMLKSYGKASLEEKNYFSKTQELSYFNPIHHTVPQNILPNETNVVILMMESFGNEWIGAAGAAESFTPFLDSLTTKGLYFKNGISNGKKSIEAVPAITASMPSFLNDPYISSPYGNNTLQSLPSILSAKGYATGFFHGATNGSMKFDGFAAQVGFDNYFGRKEYNNDQHFDKTWGIMDEYFMPWSAQKMSTYEKPFFTTVFSLSSHHPYYIPPHMRGKLKKGKHPIAEAIHYGDYSLRKFFEEAKNQPWYSNTIFVICADHTSSTDSPLYGQRTEMYKIPILFFHPQGLIKPTLETDFFQHIDILPTLLDLLNVKTTYYSIGQSYYQRTKKESITFLEDTYYYFCDDYLLTFSNDKARNLYNAKIQERDTPDSISFYKEKSQAYEKRLKAIIQRYNRDLIQNQTSAHEKKNSLHH